MDHSVSTQELLNIFSAYGDIESMRSLPERDCAFINFANLENAISAKEAMQGAYIGNCIVKIGFGKVEAAMESTGLQPTKSLWVGNIPAAIESSDLEAYFAVYGPVESVRILVIF
jgi:protein JSN1